MTQYGVLNLRLSRDRLNRYQTEVLLDYQRRIGALDGLASTLYRKEAQNDFRKVYTADDMKGGYDALKAFIEKWGRTYPTFRNYLSISGNILAFHDYPKCIRMVIHTSNPIENFNASVKRELRKRISLNSKTQADICLAAISESLNGRMASRKIRGYWELTEDGLKSFGFNPKSRSDETE